MKEKKSTPKESRKWHLLHIGTNYARPKSMETGGLMIEKLKSIIQLSICGYLFFTGLYWIGQYLINQQQPTQPSPPLSSFQQQVIREPEKSLTERPMQDRYKLLTGNFRGINSHEDIARYIKDNVRYEIENFDVWTSPSETLNRGYGDCDDYALLYMNLAYLNLGIKMDFVAVNDIDRTIKTGDPTHAEVRYRGQHYNIYTREKLEKTVVFYSYEFDELFDH
ncbi:MAG: hypothetical protein JXR86_08965 [Spirochaetales bacterium]|nr:hypothetical protein [Calditrichota bacterium]MBN2657177.1 hypothetical protein [Spirochaetales bacterium]